MPDFYQDTGLAIIRRECGHCGTWTNHVAKILAESSSPMAPVYEITIYWVCMGCGRQSEETVKPK